MTDSPMALLTRLSLLLLLLSHRSTGDTIQIACPEFHPALNYPCQCGLNDFNATKINCDGAVFAEFPILPYRFYIQEFSQRDAGLQTLGAQLFTASDVPLAKVDFSRNQIRRLTERLFDGVEDTLEELRLADNLLGDNLNPLFATDELLGLVNLRSLDLSGNLLTEIDDGVLKGCKKLKELNLNSNLFRKVPSGVLKGPEALHNLHLQDNKIDRLSRGDFSSQPKLLSLNLTNNLIADIETGAFANASRLVRLILARNRLNSISHDAIKDLSHLVELDLANNFFEAVPVQALKVLKNIKFLNLGSNKIKSVKDSDLQHLASLEYLDLSRNQLNEINPGTFGGMASLKGLDMSVNNIRKLDDTSLEGLTSLEYLDVSDNRLSAMPSAALSKLTAITRLKADYNRIGAISAEVLASVSNLQELSLAHNSIHELADGTFGALKSLRILNLFGNRLTAVATSALAGPEASLEYVDLGNNLIGSVAELSVAGLKYLNLEGNELRDIDGAFNLLSNLQVLVLRGNRISKLTEATFMGMENLISLDISKNLIREMKPGVLKNQYLNEVNMSRNFIKELEEAAFKDLSILEVLDLSRNGLSGISNGAFTNVPRLKRLVLSHNSLSSYKGDFFRSGDAPDHANDTDLHTLDLSHNELTYLYPESFTLHPGLKTIDFSHNRFSFFPAQFIKELANLQELNLSHNAIKTLDGPDYANLTRLRRLDLSHNEIEAVSEAAFQNSSQLQVIDLSWNKISGLASDTFSGSVRLQLDLSHNNLSDMAKGIFERPKVMKLQSLDLSHNSFDKIPVDVLQSQYFFLDTLRIAHNRITDIPSDANILVNIKEIDLSFNPLTEDSIRNVLNEPKTVRSLNMAGTGIMNVPVLETPFLTHLNLSHNKISVLNEDILGKPSLHSLDVSHNEIPNLSFGLTSAWPRLKKLTFLDISSNPIVYIIKGDFDYLDSLESLSMNDLPKCSKVERGAFAHVGRVKHFNMVGLPRVVFMDVKGILESFRALEHVRVEMKDALLGDHLSPAYTPRLRSMEVTGAKLENVAIGALAGMTSPELDLSLRDTHVANVPTALFFPVPMSSRLNVDVSRSRLTSLAPQLINAIDSNQRHIRVTGLASNPVFCDCNARALQRWLKDKVLAATTYGDLGEVRCAAPGALAGKILSDLPEEELTCEGRVTTTTTELEFLTQRVTTTPEPDIITGASNDSGIVTTPKPKSKHSKESPSSEPSLKTASPYNMDALIIGIVGGVVAFIAIIIIIICIVRLRLSDSQYRGGPLAGPLALRAQGKCTCLKPVAPTIYGTAPSVAGGYLSYPSTPVPPPHAPLALTWAGNGTINSGKFGYPPPPPSVHGNGSNFGTVGAHSYLSAAGTVVSRASFPPGAFPPGYPGGTPYYVTFPAEDSDGDHMTNNGRESSRR